MKIKYFLSASIFLVMLALQHCDKHELTELEKLPPLTTNGKGTFGCLVDGKAWVIESIPDAQAYYQTGTLFISAFLITSKIDQGIVMGASQISLNEQAYTLANYPDIFGQFNDHNINCQFRTSSSHTGTLTITHLDKTNFIISGTFAFDAHGTNCSKTVKITEGRFDIHYAP